MLLWSYIVGGFAGKGSCMLEGEDMAMEVGSVSVWTIFASKQDSDTGLDPEIASVDKGTSRYYSR